MVGQLYSRWPGCHTCWLVDRSTCGGLLAASLFKECNHLALPTKERKTILRNIGYNLAQLLESELPKMIVQAQREREKRPSPTVANLKNENFKSVYL